MAICYVEERKCNVAIDLSGGTNFMGDILYNLIDLDGNKLVTVAAKTPIQDIEEGDFVDLNYQTQSFTCLYEIDKDHFIAKISKIFKEEIKKDPDIPKIIDDSVSDYLKNNGVTKLSRDDYRWMSAFLIDLIEKKINRDAPRFNEKEKKELLMKIAAKIVHDIELGEIFGEDEDLIRYWDPDKTVEENFVEIYGENYAIFNEKDLKIKDSRKIKAYTSPAHTRYINGEPADDFYFVFYCYEDKIIATNFDID